ncbi:sigma-54-dependent Fis family transcriptional regulator [Pseudomonas sp. CFBP 8771]|uniref:sigma 54-interacting transcriptional regulator n=1 Tax=Pseudomonas sp. CFBP 8771 TaxID=2775285 RepID=UPI00177B4C10|nr:sigma 54-interacting transcriptional regulator [Pseudomonas sp. CFBP 8771]MBD8601800.1 sigma-54-dependent Fis family transcriptional regulator [Pseudomonas sp. CFBP 8771]
MPVNSNAYPCEPCGLLGDSQPMRDLYKLINKFSTTDSPVLIRGEAGTGKQLIARALHQQSARRLQPFIVFDCQARAHRPGQTPLFAPGCGETNVHPLSGSVLQAVHRGTLLLEQVHGLPLDIQEQLLRFLQRKGSGEVDVRVVATSDSDLAGAMRKGQLREDLYYRLNVLEIVAVPLRERYGDLAMLANHFAQRYSRENGRRHRPFSQEALIAMGEHDWPGNVRELSTRVRQAQALAHGNQIEAGDLGLGTETLVAAPLGTLQDYKHRAERQALGDVLLRHGGNLSTAARVLGVSRPTLYRLLHKHHMR